MTRIRVLIRRIHVRMGRWFWPVMIALIPIVVHEIDHIGLAIVDAASFPDNRIPTFDDLITQAWGPVAGVRWHNLIVFLGTFVIIIFLAILAKENLPSGSETNVDSACQAGEDQRARASNSGNEASSIPSSTDLSLRITENRRP